MRSLYAFRSELAVTMAGAAVAISTVSMVA